MKNIVNITQGLGLMSTPHPLVEAQSYSVQSGLSDKDIRPVQDHVLFMCFDVTVVCRDYQL